MEATRENGTRRMAPAETIGRRARLGMLSKTRKVEEHRRTSRPANDVDVQHMQLAPENAYFASLGHVYTTSTSRSLVTHYCNPRTTSRSTVSTTARSRLVRNVAALSTVPGQVYTCYRAVPTPQIDRRNIAETLQKHRSSMRQRVQTTPSKYTISTLSLHRNPSNTSFYHIGVLSQPLQHVLAADNQLELAAASWHR